MKEIVLFDGTIAFVDDEDFDRINQFKYSARLDDGGWYAQRTIVLGGGRRTTTTMHRDIMRAARGQIVDHVNGNGLDNRRENLRFATPRANCRNRKTHSNNQSGYRGVRMRNGKWLARIAAGPLNARGHSSEVHLGTFDTPEEAFAARLAAEQKYFGEFARSA